MSERVVITAITRVSEAGASTDQDLVAAEAPLEILLAHPPSPTGYGGQAFEGRTSKSTHSLGLVMRTPGDDEDLVMGLLVSEQIVASPAQVRGITFEAETGPDAEAADAHPARARVTLTADIDLAAFASTRALDRTSACGMCGRLSMQALHARGGRRPDAPPIDAGVIESIPARLRRGQPIFAETGGLHAAALCTLDGHPWIVREDVGRHNAVDKVVGSAFRAGRLPATEAILAVSGRVAYEIVQKATAAGVVGIVAVGAPSSLAVDAARAAGLTLIGFTREGRFNIYAGRERVRLERAVP